MFLFREKKHIVFLIHGIAGSRRHFGYTAKALKTILNNKDKSTRFIVKHIEYDTGNDKKGPYDFAKDIKVEIEKFVKSKRFKPQDKYSLIMHSQGGLIGAIWLFQSLRENPEYGTSDVVKNLDCFITLGTPFWGAKSAKWGAELKQLCDKFKVKVPLKFGTTELLNMSFGSDTIFDFRMALIDPSFTKVIAYLKQNVRFLNVIGVANLLNPLGIFISGTDQYEDDGAVPMSSAKFNFIYSQSIVADYKDQEVVLKSNNKEINMAPYVYVNAMHLSILPEVSKFAGIAQVFKKCIKNEDCKHPSFPYMYNQILGNEIYQIDESLGDFKTFLIDINVRIPENVNLDVDDIKIEFSKLDGTSLIDSNLEIAKQYELYSQGKYKSSKYQNHLRYYFTGSLKKILEKRDEYILMKMSAKGLKSRCVELKIKPACSSFVDINLLVNS